LQQLDDREAVEPQSPGLTKHLAPEIRNFGRMNKILNWSSVPLAGFGDFSLCHSGIVLAAFDFLIVFAALHR
jgi:hypothetical protein